MTIFIYAYHDSDGWHYEVVDVSSDEGCYASLGIDSTGKMYISYYDSGNDDLKYVTNRSGSWVAETVDSEGDVGRYTSLAIDSKDKVHISYFSYLWLIGDLKYATNKSGSWVTETLQYLGYKPREFDGSTSLAIDSTDKVHISYYDWGNYDLKYARSSSSPLEIVNNLVTLEPIKSTYQTTSDTTGCGDVYVGQFSFDARLTNICKSPLNGLVAEVTELTNNNLLQNADGGAGGVGARLTVQNEVEYADGVLGPGEFVDVHFIICLTDNKPFRFVVNVLGLKEDQIGFSQVAAPQSTSMKSRHAKFKKGSGVTRKGFFGRFRPYPVRNRPGH